VGKTRKIAGVLSIFLAAFAALFWWISQNVSLPKIMVWAWEQPQDLRFLKDDNMGVACYAGTITLKGGNIIFTSRRQLLNFNRKTAITPVIRIENKDASAAVYDSNVSEIAELIVEQCLSGEASGCQIDYDARNSEISFYKKIIAKTRELLPRAIPLSITALVSWCDKNSWLQDAAIDEAVPMFFSMGPDSRDILNGLTGESFLQEKKCQTSIGISADEPLPPRHYLANKRIYIFHSASWNQKSLFDIINQL